VESLEPVSCEALLGEEEASARTEPTTNRSANKSRGKAPTNRTGCRQLLSEGERAQLGRVEETVAYLQRGGATPPALAIPADTQLRSWVDGNICRLGGAEREDRGALAWHVWQGTGECGGWTARAAQFPLSIGLGWWLGMILTPLIILPSCTCSPATLCASPPRAAPIAASTAPSTRRPDPMAEAA
jgi:hypothetical protein